MHRPPLGFATDDLYRLARSGSSQADFHDVTDGDNRLDSDIGFAAARGFDVPTGLGSPDVSRLLADLAGAQRGLPAFDDSRPVDRGAAAAFSARTAARTTCVCRGARRQYATAPLPVAAAWRCSSAR